MGGSVKGNALSERGRRGKKRELRRNFPKRRGEIVATTKVFDTLEIAEV